MIRTNFLKSLCALILMIAVLASCNKEEVAELENTETTTGVNALDRLAGATVKEAATAEATEKENECFAFNYPITLIEPDGTETEINDEDALDQLLEMYYRDNEDIDIDELDITLLYPVEVTLEDGSVEAISNDEELDDLLEDCFEIYEEEYFEDCFEFQYPVTVLFPDGTTQVANSDDDLYMIEDTFYREDTDEMEDLSFVYPISIILDDGTEKMIENDDALDRTFDACEKHDCDDDGRGGDRDGDRGDHDKERCFEVIFPITIVLADGTEESIESKRDLRKLVKSLDEEEEDEDGREDEDEKPFSIVFPIEVMLEDESVTSVDSEEAFETLKDSCED